MLVTKRNVIGLYLITNVKNVAIYYLGALSEGIIRGFESVECVLEKGNL